MTAGQALAPGAALPPRAAPDDQPAGSTQGVGLWVFMGVATTLFTLFIVAYVMRMSERDAITLALPWQLWLSSAWLLAGSLLLQGAASRPAADSAAARRLLLAGGGCALAFIATQWWAWEALLGRQVSVHGNPAGSFFFLLTAMHVLHVAGGLAGWVVALRKLGAATATAAANHWRIALCARYWHFLFAVWLLLLATMRFITPELAALICGSR